MISSTPSFVTEFFEAHKGFEKSKVLEVGSLNDDNGTIHERLPKGIDYVGLDMHEGAMKRDMAVNRETYDNNVDALINAHDLLAKFSPETFDIVFCFDTFEHDDAFWISWENIKAVTKKGGYIVLGVPGRFTPSHTDIDNYPFDHWRFMEDSFKNYFFKGFEDVYIKVLPYKDWNQQVENEIYGWGRKK